MSKLCRATAERHNRSHYARGRGKLLMLYVAREVRFAACALQAPRRAVARAVCLAIPGQIVEFVDEERFLARVDVSGVRRVVNVALVSGDERAAQEGDWVLIHVGFAISVVDEAEALATRRLLEQIGSEYEAELEEFEQSGIT